MNVLYLTYDGLLDPLGDSQILPYIEGIRSEAENFFIISFEKKTKKAIEIEAKNAYLLKKNIIWIKLSFSKSSNVFFKIFDMLKLYFTIFKMLIFNNIDLIHARGHPTASSAMFFKKIFGFKLLFDFRGLWADEKVTKGGWDLLKRTHFLQYKYYKNKENKLFINSDMIVVLTKKVALEIQSIHPSVSKKITIIPCAADYNHFFPIKSKTDDSGVLDCSSNSIVFGYLGSVGPMYQFQRYLRLIQLARKNDIDANGLIITQNRDLAETEIKDFYQSEIPKFFKIISAKRSEIPKLINQMSCLVSFYTIKYSVISVSPTKIGETLACGVPIICNSGIGDTNEIIKSLDSGLVIKDTSDESLEGAISGLEKILTINPALIRNKSKKIFDLGVAVAKYRKIYTFFKSIEN